MAAFDSETGEIFSSDEAAFDFETGEPIRSSEGSQTTTPKRKFHVPKEYLKQNNNNDQHKKFKKCDVKSIKQSFPLCGQKAVYGLNKDIIMGYNTVSHRLVLMLPILFIFPKLPAILVAIFELLIHVWAHKKNKTLADSGVYYRSPLHIITAEFCYICRSRDAMNKIGKMQDQRKSNYLRNTYDCVRRAMT